MEPGDECPCCVELELLCLRGRRCVGAGSGSTSGPCLKVLSCRLLRCNKFDYVGDEKVTGDGEEERGTEKEVLSPVVVTADAYENSILCIKLEIGH